MASQKEVTQRPHHQRKDLCVTRAKYRQGRKLTAVKVYTVNDESPHILVFGVPSLGLQDDLKRVSSKCGDIKSLVVVPGYSLEEFTDTYHIQYSRVQSARHAKRRLDGLSFYGGVLHVCYAPEMETVAETRAKLVQRRKDVACRVSGRQPQPVSGTRSKSLKEMKKMGLCINYSKTNPRRSSVITAATESVGCIWKGQPVASLPRNGNESKESNKTAVVYGPLLPEGLKIAPKPVNESLVTPIQVSKSFNWASKNKFIPRQIAVKKKIIFRESRDSEENEPSAKQSRLNLELAEDNAVIETHNRIEQSLQAISVPNTEVNLSQGKSFLNME